jgi:hypothetical protein
VVNYNRMKLMLRPDKTPAAVAGKLVDIYDFPDGRLEIRWKGLPLPYSAFDQLQRVASAIGAETSRRVAAASDAAGDSLPAYRRKSVRSAHRVVGKNSGRAFALHPGAQALEHGFGIEGEVGGAHRTLPISKGNSGRRGLRTAYKKD